MTEPEAQGKRRKVWIVLPAFNEEADLPPLLERIEEAMNEANLSFEILIVDDGSTDHTYEIAEQWSNKIPLRVQRHELNQGLGTTLRDGVQWACQLADSRDFIVTLEADNSHTPELILRLVRLIREGHDVVVASRFRPGSRVRGLPMSRRILSRFAGIVFKITFPIPGIKDYTSGYRAYKAGLLQKVINEDPQFFDQDGFQVMVDILLKLRRDKDLVFGEVPMILRYDYKQGESKMDIWGTSTATLGLLARRRMG